MHELATTKNIVAICQKQQETQGFRRVLEIRLRIGALSGIVPECLRDFFPYVSEGTVCEGAALAWEFIPAAVRCADCGYEGAARGYDCPRCGSAAIHVTAGREFYVENISVE